MKVYCFYILCPCTYMYSVYLDIAENSGKQRGEYWKGKHIWI